MGKTARRCVREESAGIAGYRWQAHAGLERMEDGGSSVSAGRPAKRETGA